MLTCLKNVDCDIENQNKQKYPDLRCSPDISKKTYSPLYNVSKCKKRTVSLYLGVSLKKLDPGSR